MLAYPKELRVRVVNAVEQGEGTIAEISTLFGVGLTFVKKMLRLHRAGEDLTPAPRWRPGGAAARARAGAAAARRRAAAGCDAGGIATRTGGTAAGHGESGDHLSGAPAAGAAPKKKAWWPVSGTKKRARSSAN